MSEDEPREAKSNEIVLTSGKKIAVGSEWWTLENTDVAVDYVDLITEARQFNGIIHLSLGAGVRDANNAGVVRVSTRFRMNLLVAQGLHSLLGSMISDALKPVDKSQTN